MTGGESRRIDEDGRSGMPDDSEDTPIPTGAADLPELYAALPAPAPVSAIRFRADVQGGSLWDLVQMETVARSRRVVQVTGDAGVGYLYFAGGRVIHAVTPRLSGEAAALEILSWTSGAFQPCERGWPTVATIHESCERLILCAAKRREDAAASNLVALGGRVDRDRGSDDGKSKRIREVVMPEMRKPNSNLPSTPVSIARNDALPDFSVMIRVGSTGAIVKNKGGSEELAGVVAYTHRLVELVGELLGLDHFVAMECMFKETAGQVPSNASRCLLFREANGDTVALRPRADSNIQALRESLGL